ncbi:MAG: hypothetical protein ACETVR_03505 [Candidatus Bathyarchaeia archaeon]
MEKRPFLVDALRLNIVNYSALSRLLQREIGRGSPEAIKAALLRARNELAQRKGLQEKKVIDLLRRTKVRLQDKIAVIISREDLDVPYLVTAHLTDSHVYIVDQTELRELGRLEEDAEITSDLVALILTSPQEVENTPGFVALITQLLASRNINILEFLSCFTNTVIVLDSKDALEAFSLLQRYFQQS